MKVAVLTAGKDPPYALGLVPALAGAGIDVEMVGNSEMANFPGLRHPKIRFSDLRGDQRADAPFFEKLRRVLLYYARLLHFSWKSQAEIFHVLWPNKFVYFDRTLLNLYYRTLGKKLVFTAHNINTEARDRRDTVLNRLTIRLQYHLMDHVFVHTAQMKNELANEYGVSPEKITVLTFPINNVTPRTKLTREDARLALGIPAEEKVILFFGRIAAYKGLEDLIQALPGLRSRLVKFRLLIAGDVKFGESDYMRRVEDRIRDLVVSDCIEKRIEDIPEDHVERYFKAADLLVLPYRRIYQSGVLFLSYSFGLPVVATDAGSLRDEIIEGETGFVARRNDIEDLVEQIYRYFQSELYADLKCRRSWIINHANTKYSWEQLAEKTCQVYEDITRQTAR